MATNYEDPNSIWEGVTACPVHDTSPMFDEDCTGCKAEADQRSEAINAMQREAQKRAAGLAQNGIPFGQPALDMIKVQIIWENMFMGRQAFLAEGELGRRALLMMRDIQRQHMAPESKLTVVRNGRTPKS